VQTRNQKQSGASKNPSILKKKKLDPRTVGKEKKLVRVNKKRKWGIGIVICLNELYSEWVGGWVHGGLTGHQGESANEKKGRDR